MDYVWMYYEYLNKWSIDMCNEDYAVNDAEIFGTDDQVGIIFFFAPLGPLED